MSSTNQGGYQYYPFYNQFRANQMPFQPSGFQGAGFGQFGQQPGFGFQPAGQQFPFPPGPSGGTIQTPGAGTTGPDVPGMLPLEQSYIENILRLNKGKTAVVYMTFEGSNEWNSKVFKGVIEAAGRDHLILSDPDTGYRYLLPMVYFNYAVFEDEIEYFYPFGGQQATYQPR